MSFAVLVDIVARAAFHSSWNGVSYTVALGLAPLVPIVGFHVNRARRLFKAGFLLDDLRVALAIDVSERANDEALALPKAASLSQSALRIATYTSAVACVYMFMAWGSVTTRGPITIARTGSFALTCILLALCNMDGVPLLPDFARRFFRTGIRDRLWNGRIGAWLAKRIGAPTTSQPVGAGVFRAAEVALGVAASELFAVLPAPQRQQLETLPAVVASLEARAADARAQIDEIEALAQRVGTFDAGLAARREQAKIQLGASVAAMEGIRLDLLRLVAGTNYLAPLTTLLDAARHVGEDVVRLADAQREVERGLAPRRVGMSRVPTPV
jgi:serine/threonine-protein kinase